MEAPGAKTAARRFGAAEPDVRLTSHAAGHIHDTWIVEAAPGRAGFVLQRVNHRVFPDCELLMANLLRVTTHLQSRQREPQRRALRALVADGGETLVGDGEGEGGRWRAFALVADATAHERVGTPEAACEVGRALGRFLASIQDLPGPPLVEPIPNFKDFGLRRDQFEVAVEFDPFGRASSCRPEIDGVRGHHHLVTELVEGVESGRLPACVVHNDAKAANVLLDDRSGEGLCVIDLDTVAPGVVLYDVGDLLRSATVTLPEDATDLGALAVRDDLLAAALAGYLREAGPLLTDGERAMFALAGPLMAYENALRFLTDHLAGDVYYRVTRPRHNLDRARAQLRVVDALSAARARVAALVQRA